MNYGATYTCRLGPIRNRNLQNAKAALEGQAQGTSLFTSLRIGLP